MTIEESIIAGPSKQKKGRLVVREVRIQSLQQTNTGFITI
jgi:hypothetical protein